jgi:hypothetical protein
MEVMSQPSKQQSHSRSIRVDILSSDRFHAANVWLGVFKAGPLCPKQLLEEANIHTLFERSIAEGLSEDQPMMLADTSIPNQPKTIFLIPESTETRLSIDQAIQTIKSWSPSSVGIYISDEQTSLFSHMLEQLIQHTTITHLAIIPGSAGYNSALNVAHSLRQKMLKDHVQLSVFH